MHTLINGLINVPKIVHPTHNTCNIVPGQVIIDSTKPIDIMNSNCLESNINHGTEQNLNWFPFVPDS